MSSNLGKGRDSDENKEDETPRRRSSRSDKLKRRVRRKRDSHSTTSDLSQISVTDVKSLGGTKVRELYRPKKSKFQKNEYYEGVEKSPSQASEAGSDVTYVSYSDDQKKADNASESSSVSSTGSSVSRVIFAKRKKKTGPEEGSVLADSLDRIDSFERTRYRKGIYDMARSSFNDNIDYEQIEEMREAFNLFDADGDGLITSKEFKIIIRSLGEYVSEYYLQKLINELDVDANEMIDFSEYIYFVNDVEFETQEFPETELFQAFKSFDLEGQGFLSANELRFALVRYGEKLTFGEVESFVKDAKPNEENKIDYEEFSALLTNI